MKVLTANRLTDGAVVWYGADHGWSEAFESVSLASNADEAARLEAIGKAACANNEVVDADLIDVSRIEGAIVPNRLRERIRANGPSNLTEPGKQAPADFRRPG